MPTITRAQRNAELDHHNAKMLLQFSREADPTITMTPVRGATPAGDEQRLRGIPAIGRGVTGAIADSRPGERLR